MEVSDNKKKLAEKNLSSSVTMTNLSATKLAQNKTKITIWVEMSPKMLVFSLFQLNNWGMVLVNKWKGKTRMWKIAILSIFCHKYQLSQSNFTLCLHIRLWPPSFKASILQVKNHSILFINLNFLALTITLNSLSIYCSLPQRKKYIYPQPTYVDYFKTSRVLFVLNNGK